MKKKFFFNTIYLTFTFHKPSNCNNKDSLLLLFDEPSKMKTKYIVSEEKQLLFFLVKIFKFVGTLYIKRLYAWVRKFIKIICS